MKKYTTALILAAFTAFLFSGNAFAQDDEPVWPIFETVNLVDNATTYVPMKGSKNLEIQHRFSDIKEIADIFGIYGSANTRIGFS